MDKNWFVYISGDTFGPLTTEIIQVMLKRTRLHFTDYIWSSGLSKWMRIAEVNDFVDLLPPYPKSPIPSESGILETLPPVPSHGKSDRTGQVSKKEPKKESVKGISKLAMHPRFKIDGTVLTESGQSFDIVDISEGGVFLASEKPLEIGTELVFRLEAKGLEEIMKMTGVVIRYGERQDQPGFAVEFMRVNPVYKRILRNFLVEKTEDD